MTVRPSSAGIAVLRRYRREWLARDVITGLTVATLLVPQSMAYAELAGVEAQAGLYAAVGALLVYAVVGTSRHLGVGPEPGTAILAATAVGGIAAGDSARYASSMAALALGVAALCIIAALLRLGFLAALLSKPVLVGYITGVGLTLLGSQLSPLTGVGIGSDRLLPRVVELAGDLGAVNGATLGIGVGTLLLVLVLRERVPAAPGALIAVGAAALAATALGLDDHGVSLVGAIPSGAPSFAVPDVTVADVVRLLPAAGAIALVAFSDNLLTARAVRRHGDDPIHANRELLALGLTNLAAGMARGLPVSSSASRTAVAAALGSHTQVVSVVAAALTVGALLFLHPVLAAIPRSALAAVVVAAGLAIIDVRGFRSLWRLSRPEVAPAVAATVGVVVFDVLVGVAVAVTAAGLLALYRVARPHDAVLGNLAAADGWVDIVEHGDARTESGLIVYRFDAPLFFVNADYYSDRVETTLADTEAVTEWLVLDFEGIGGIDTTATEALGGLLGRVGEGRVDVIAIARGNDKVLDHLARAGLLAPHGQLRVFPTINSAVRAFRQRHAADNDHQR